MINTSKMAILGAKAGISGGVFGQKLTNAAHTLGAKHGAVFNRAAITAAEGTPGRGDIGGGRTAPGNSRNAVANGSRDGPTRPEDMKSMADPRPKKRSKTLESNRKNKGS